jgi:hypothetical protein
MESANILRTNVRAQGRKLGIVLAASLSVLGCQKMAGQKIKAHAVFMGLEKRSHFDLKNLNLKPEVKEKLMIDAYKFWIIDGPDADKTIVCAGPDQWAKGKGQLTGINLLAYTKWTGNWRPTSIGEYHYYAECSSFSAVR